MTLPNGQKRPGKINPEGGEPEKGAPDVGDSDRTPDRDPHDGDEPFPPEDGVAGNMPPAEE